MSMQRLNAAIAQHNSATLVECCVLRFFLWNAWLQAQRGSAPLHLHGGCTHPHAHAHVHALRAQVNKDPELLLIIKTRSELLPQLTAFVKDKANHPYDEPEVIALPIQGGSPTYLAWLMDSTKAAS